MGCAIGTLRGNTKCQMRHAVKKGWKSDSPGCAQNMYRLNQSTSSGHCTMYYSQSVDSVSCRVLFIDLDACRAKTYVSWRIVE